MIKLVNNSLWDPMRKNAAKYYEKAQLIDKAMALWILHFHDHLYINKADSDSKRNNQLHADSVKSIIIFTNYKRKLESLRSSPKCQPLSWLEKIIEERMLAYRKIWMNESIGLIDGEENTDNDLDEFTLSLPNASDYIGIITFEGV